MKKSTKKSLVIFDMDGTLINSSVTIANSINHVRKHLELEPMPMDHIVSRVNDHNVRPAEYFYGVDAFETKHEQWFTDYYSNNHAQELLLYDGIYDLLKHLRGDRVKGNHVKVALATNAYRVSTLESLEHLGISAFFDAIVCADDVARGKPYPDMLYKILSELDCTNEEAIFVGDGPRDEDAAKAAYMDYLMVDWGFTKHSKDMKVISCVKELESELKKRVER